MPDALTQSFCERCGTRYEFKAPTRLNPLRKTRGLVSGLRNYIMSQDALSDAVGDAMRSEEELLAARQLESFHESFNFCIDCRQYTCNSCWNDDQGRCRTCAPVAGTDDLIERFEAAFAGETAAAEIAPTSAEAWPSADLADGASVLDWPAAELRPEPHAFGEPTVAEVEPVVAEPEPEPEPVVFQTDPEPEPEPVVAEPEPEPVVAEIEPEPEPVVVAWDADAPFDLAPEPIAESAEQEPSIVFAEAPPLVVEELPSPTEAERPAPARGTDMLAEAEIIDQPAEAPTLPVEELVHEAEPEPVVAEIEPEPVVAEVEPEAEPVVAEVEPEAEPEPVAAEIEPDDAPVVQQPEAISPRPVSLPRPPTPAAAPADDEARVAAAAAAVDPALAARRAQLDSLGLGDTARGPLPSGGRALRPYRSSGAGIHPMEAAQPDRAAPTTPGQAIRASMWDASAREVAGDAGAVGVQSCGSCGLALSASARFCRRCGSPQARTA